MSTTTRGDDGNAADMDNPQMVFTGNWVDAEGPSQCEIDNDHIRTTNETNSSMSWPFNLQANTLDIIGSGVSTSGALVQIQIDNFSVTVDTSTGLFPLAEGATNDQVGQCSYIASIGGIQPGTAHKLTITHRGPGNNTSLTGPPILTLSTLNWRQDAQDSRTDLHLISAPSTTFPTSSSSSSSSTSSNPAATPGAADSSSSSSHHSGHTTALAVGVAISLVTLIIVGVFFWLHYKRRRDRLPRKRRSHVKLVAPEDSLRSSFNSIIFEKPSPVVKTDSQRPILRSFHVPHSTEAVELSPIRATNAASLYHEHTTQGSSPTTSPSHTPQRRISRKPVPRSSEEVSAAESGVLEDPFLDPPSANPYRPRPDSDTLARREAEGRPSSEA